MISFSIGEWIYKIDLIIKRESAKYLLLARSRRSKDSGGGKNEMSGLRLRTT